jgi:hypothetical protein
MWIDLRGSQNMTFAPASCLAVRHEFQNHASLSNDALGIVGDDNHVQSGSSYHLGKSALRPNSYTIVESSRDKNGLSEAASANDIGYFSIRVGDKTHTLRTFSAWLVGQCKAGTADTRDIREVIYSTDGQVVRRWDRLGIRSTGDDSHLSHTHISWFRDSEDHDRAAVVRRYFAEIMEDKMAEGLELDKTPVKYPTQAAGNPTWTGWNALGSARDLSQEARDRVKALQGDVAALKAQLTQLGISLTTAIQALATKDQIDEQALGQSLASGVAAAVIAALPSGSDPITVDEVQVALQRVLAAAFSASGTT